MNRRTNSYPPTPALRRPWLASLLGWPLAISSALVASVVLLPACNEDDGPGGPPPSYSVRGPSAVGYRQIEVQNPDGVEPLRLKAWYPARNPSRKMEELTYELSLKRGDFQTGTPAVVYGKAIANAPSDGTRAPYPLVVFSHGFSLNPEWYSDLVEHYASRGFVVLAPEHVEDDWFRAVEASFDRPRDVTRTLDFAEQLTAPDGALSGQIDMKNIAVVGHSYGGYTALSSGGARWHLAPFQARCAALGADDPKNFLCAPFVGRESDMAALAGLASVPDGLWPNLGDPRVTAIVSIAGDAYLMNQAGLSNITIPLMAIGGTEDFGTPWEWGSQPSYDHASSAKKALVALEGADHMIAVNSCEHMPFTASLPDMERTFVCVDPVWEKLRALNLIRHFTTAFLLDMLKGDARAHGALLSKDAQFPGIGYTTTLQ